MAEFFSKSWTYLKKNPKYLVIIALILIFCVCYVIDYAIARSYDFEITSMPSVVYADPQQPVEITIQLTRNGVPVVGHDLYAHTTGPNAAGKFQQNRVRTNENGEATFIYYPYRATVTIPAKPVDIRVIDESNSKILVIHAEFNFVLDLQKP